MAKQSNIRQNCQLCDSSYKSKDSLRTHINVRHTKNIIYKCKKCDFETYNDVSFKQHENRVHQKLKVWTGSLLEYML